MSKESMARDQAQALLMAYATQWLATWSGQAAALPLDGLPADTGALDPYRALLAGDRAATQPGEPLLSIFSRIKQEDGPDPPQVYWPAVPLSLKTPAYPVARDEARPAPGLWDGFRAEWGGIRDLAAGMRFEAFTHLLHKWAWAVPCRYGEPGMSLYDEFRALSALVHASGCALEPAGTFQLVGGDIPGIQDFVYTITSKGAAKGLRGRSFFIQLLGDAVVRRLLAELKLPPANVVYDAGGNFVLLAPAGADEIVAALAAEINRALLGTFEGDLALCLACEPLAAGELAAAGFAGRALPDLKAKIARQKRRRFAKLAAVDWDALFAPTGRGGVQFCSVCQHERQEQEAGRGLGDGWMCTQCAGFVDLAEAIAYDPLLMSVDPQKPEKGGEGWQELLWELAECWYSFGQDLDTGASPETRTYHVNSLARPSARVQGYRLIANTTPRGERGQVRTFSDLAAAADGLRRVGVLRMDVDNLGWVFSAGLPGLSLPGLGALSRLMEHFFGGYLDTIVRQVGGQDLYIIYAGGDDLFVVGAWHHLPDLAEAIRDAFWVFTGANPALTLSGGLTLEGAHFPLYRAAERAGEAEHKAKAYTRPDGPDKDAFCFLDTVAGWEEWAAVVRPQKDELLWLLGVKDNPKEERRLPRALLQIVQGIHAIYYDDLLEEQRQARESDDKKEPDPRLFYGRWMWMKAYSLTRLAARRKNKVISGRVGDLQQKFMRPETVRHSGLAARWAEYLTRKEERS